MDDTSANYTVGVHTELKHNCEVGNYAEIWVLSPSAVDPPNMNPTFCSEGEFVNIIIALKISQLQEQIEQKCMHSVCVSLQT